MNLNITIRKAPSVTLARVLTTYELHGVSRPTLNGARDFDPSNPSQKWIRGLPDTQQYDGATQDEQGHVTLTEDLQWWWYEINAARVPNRTEAEYHAWFNSMTTGDRWTTNFYGSDTCAVYPTKTNLDKEPMRFFTLLTGNAIIELAGPARKIYNVMRYPFYAINASKPFKHYNPSDHPYRFYQPVNSVRTPLLKDGKWISGEPTYAENGYEAFPQFDGRSVTPLLMPRSDIGWIDASLVRVLSQGEMIPSPFNR